MHLSYHVRIKKTIAAHFANTVYWYRRALDFYIDFCLKKWDSISGIREIRYQIKYIEEQTIAANARVLTVPDESNFKQQFPDFPPYLRRVAIRQARGLVSAYFKRLNKWNTMSNNNRSKRPGHPSAGEAFPYLYHRHMYQRIDLHRAKIKVYNNGKWEWCEVDLCRSDANYIKKNCSDGKEKMPKLVKKGAKWFLKFPFEFDSKVMSVPLEKQIAIGVDLGINNICTCVAMDAKGNIIASRFLHRGFANEIMASIGSKKRRNPQISISQMIINGRHQICRKASKFIRDFALEYDGNVVVFEKLDNREMSNKVFFSMSKKIQKMVERKCEKKGIKTEYVCAWNTSRYAFDGSGTVKRDKDNPSICTFRTGKIYNCDLSAAYNIAARYFIREIFNSLTKESRRSIAAKVPQCVHRASSTLDTLLQMQSALADGASSH